MRRHIAAALALSGSLLFIPVGASPSYAGTCVSAGLQGGSATCVWTFTDYQQTATSGDGHVWVVTVQPDNGGIQNSQLICVENGETGLWHDVFMDGIDVGDVCAPDTAVDEPNLAQIAIREFKRFKWPVSDLRTQPPGGKTLVNLDTVFLTGNTGVSSKDLVIGGRRLRIEATPTTYTWVFGDGSETSTASPGHKYPNHDVFHVYKTTDTVSARVDTTYSGRFRIGNGDWKTIDETVTVTGAAEMLDVLEAKPQLVIR